MNDHLMTLWWDHGGGADTCLVKIKIDKTHTPQQWGNISDGGSLHPVCRHNVGLKGNFLKILL